MSSALPSRLRSPQAWGTGRVLGFPFLVASSRCHRKGSDQARAGFVAQRRGCRRQRGPGSRASVSRGCSSQIWVPAPCPLTRGPWRVSGHWAGHTLEGLRPSGTATWQLCNYHTWPGKKKKKRHSCHWEPRDPPQRPSPFLGVSSFRPMCVLPSPRAYTMAGSHLSLKHAFSHTLGSSASFPHGSSGFTDGVVAITKHVRWSRK